MKLIPTAFLRVLVLSGGLAVCAGFPPEATASDVVTDYAAYRADLVAKIAAHRKARAAAKRQAAKEEKERAAREALEEQKRLARRVGRDPRVASCCWGHLIFLESGASSPNKQD